MVVDTASGRTSVRAFSADSNPETMIENARMVSYRGEQKRYYQIIRAIGEQTGLKARHRLHVWP